MAEPVNPIRPADDAARALARRLLADATHAALAVIHPDDGGPCVSRVAVGTDAGGAPLLLVSALALHTRGLRADPAVSLLLGEPGAKGDPLTHPRLTLQARAEVLLPAADDGAGHAALREAWLRRHPKARIYLDLPDFSFVRLILRAGYLNGGFGRAYHLTPADLMPADLMPATRTPASGTVP